MNNAAQNLLAILSSQGQLTGSPLQEAGPSAGLLTMTGSAGLLTVTGYLCPRGRPMMDLPVDQIRSYLLCGFTAGDIAQFYSISGSTIRRRMKEHGMILSDLYSKMTHEELDTVVSQIQSLYPNSGFRFVLGHLHAQGIRVQDARVLKSLRRVDPEGVQLRGFSGTLRHRLYSAAGPNTIWHIDGNHKLMRWRCVVHGGIDGCSRLIVCLTAATNNRAAAALQSFLEAVSEYGVPSRIKSDKGGENVDVVLFMISNRGPDRHSHISGRSVHNQRIEWLWRDVYENFLGKFHHFFYDLEAEGLLNPDNEIDLYALHWTFLPQLQRHLALFKEGWNNHKLRTARNQSP